MLFQLLAFVVFVLTVNNNGVESKESKGLTPALKKVTDLIEKGRTQDGSQKEFWKQENTLEAFDTILQHFYKKDAKIPLEHEYESQMFRLIKFTTAAIANCPTKKQKDKCEIPSRLITKFGAQINSRLAQPAPQYHQRTFRFGVLELNEQCKQDCPANNSVVSVVDKYMERLGAEIRNNNLAEAHETAGLGLLMNSTFYRELVPIAFAGNISNFDNVYRLNIMRMSSSGAGGKFLEQHIWDKRTGEISFYYENIGWNLYLGAWHALLGEVKKLGWNAETKRAIQKMALWIKDDRRNFGQEIEKKGQEPVLRDIKDGVPDGIAALFWATRCKIQNAHTKEYLTASKENDTQVNLVKAMEGMRTYWILEPYMELRNGSMKLVPFQIRSADWKRGHDYLCVHNPGRNVTQENPIEVQLCYRTKHERRFNITLGWHLKPENGSAEPSLFRIGAWNGTNDGSGGIHKLYPRAIGRNGKTQNWAFALWQTSAQKDVKNEDWLIKCE